MRILSAFLLTICLALNAQAQSGFVGALPMEDNPKRTISLYDLMEFKVVIPELEELGLPIIDLIDMPSALLDSSKIGRVNAYELGIYYKKQGFGYRLSTRQLTAAQVDNILHMDNGNFVAEPEDVYLIGIEVEGDTPKYLHLFVRIRGNVQNSLIEGTPISDKVISFRFEELPLFYIR